MVQVFRIQTCGVSEVRWINWTKVQMFGVSLGNTLVYGHDSAPELAILLDILSHYHTLNPPPSLFHLHLYWAACNWDSGPHPTLLLHIQLSLQPETWAEWFKFKAPALLIRTSWVKMSPIRWEQFQFPSQKRLRQVYRFSQLKLVCNSFESSICIIHFMIYYKNLSWCLQNCALTSTTANILDYPVKPIRRKVAFIQKEKSQQIWNNNHLYNDGTVIPMYCIVVTDILPL